MKGRRDLTLDYWRKNVDNLLTFQEKDILQGKGSISNAEAEDIVKGIYDTFNAKRKQLDAQQADAEDIKMLEDLEKSIIEKQNDNKWPLWLEFEYTREPALLCMSHLKQKNRHQRW